MKFRSNPNLTSFSLCKELDCVVTHDQILELPTDLYTFFYNWGATSVEEIISICDDDVEEVCMEYEIEEDDVAELADVIRGHTEDYLEEYVTPPVKDNISLSNFDDEIEIYESDGGDFADIPDED